MHKHSLCFESDDLYNIKVMTSLVQVSELMIQYFSCSQLIFAQPVNSLAYSTHNINIQYACIQCKNIYCYVITGNDVFPHHSKVCVRQISLYLTMH